MHSTFSNLVNLGPFSKFIFDSRGEAMKQDAAITVYLVVLQHLYDTLWIC